MTNIFKKNNCGFWEKGKIWGERYYYLFPMVLARLNFKILALIFQEYCSAEQTDIEVWKGKMARK